MQKQQRSVCLWCRQHPICPVWGFFSCLYRLSFILKVLRIMMMMRMNGIHRLGTCWCFRCIMLFQVRSLDSSEWGIKCLSSSIWVSLAPLRGLQFCFSDRITGSYLHPTSNYYVTQTQHYKTATPFPSWVGSVLQPGLIRCLKHYVSHSYWFR